MVLRRLGGPFEVKKYRIGVLISLSSNLSGAKRNSYGKTTYLGVLLHRYGVRHL